MIEITLDGIKEVREKLAKLEASLDPTEILDEAEALLLNRIRTRFLAETDPDGNKWPESKAAKKRRASGGTGTLFDTGTLFRSLQAYAKGLDERAIGTDVPYAPFLQFGTDKLPARVFLGIGEEDLMLVERLVLLRIEEAVE